LYQARSLAGPCASRRDEPPFGNQLAQAAIPGRGASGNDVSHHLTMAILAYGAYFAAFHEPFQQYVGGGADVVWAQWPSVAPL
jgi:hypothetical protein